MNVQQEQLILAELKFEIERLVKYASNEPIPSTIRALAVNILLLAEYCARADEQHFERMAARMAGTLCKRAEDATLVAAYDKPPNWEYYQDLNNSFRETGKLLNQIIEYFHKRKELNDDKE